MSTAALALVLAGLMSLLIVGIAGLNARTTAVERSVRALSAYQGVQRAIAAEAFAEAGYRRAPRTAGRLRVEQAIADVSASVAAVRALDSRRDDGSVNYLLVLNGRYEAEVRASLRAGTAAPATSVDDRVAGPALDAMQGLVDASVTHRQQVADQALAEQRALTHRLWLLGPTAFVVLMLVIGLCWSVILKQQRILHGRAQASEHKARHDVLTGVGNRALLSEQLKVELDKQVPDAALLMIDLDHFKQINDRHGHGAGDEVLRVVASRLRQACGTVDVVCRMGGDEFAIIVRPAAGAPTVTAEVTRLLAEPVKHGDLSLMASGSVGGVRLRKGMDERDVLTAADEALYVSKRAGRVPNPRGPQVRA